MYAMKRQMNDKGVFRPYRPCNSHLCQVLAWTKLAAYARR